MKTFQYLPYILILFVFQLVSCASLNSTPTPTAIPPTETPVPPTETPVPPTFTPAPPTPTPHTDYLINGATSPSCIKDLNSPGVKNYVQNGQYHMALKFTADSLQICNEKKFTDFTFEADATWVDNGKTGTDNQFGLLFRDNPTSNADQYYYFVVSANGWATIKYENLTTNADENLFDWVSVPQIAPGQTVHLKVVASGNQFSGYVNDTLVKTVQDTRLASGWVGLGMGIHDADWFEAYFENAKVSTQP